MERLPDVKIAVESALTTLGNGNWKMGEGVQVGGRNARGDDNEESAILEHFTRKDISQLIACRPLTLVLRVFRRRDHDCYEQSEYTIKDFPTARHRRYIPSE
jgi:exocyst complex component 7